MNAARLSFLGAGNIAGAIIRGLIASGYDPAQITAADPSDDQLARLAHLGIACTNDNFEALAAADAVLLCVKPGVVAQVASEIAPGLEEQTLVISLVAGVPSHALRTWLGGRRPLVRCMPNTPATIGEGVAALFATKGVTVDHQQIAETILASVGRTVWVQSDDEVDIATALSGSGPAYFFYVMEAMEAAGTRLGLDTGTSRALVLQTAIGAARLILERGSAPAVLRAEVTSPGGTTQAAIERMEELGLMSLVDAGVGAAHRRAQELAREFG